MTNPRDSSTGVYTVSQKNAPTLKRYSSKTIRINFDNIRQKYSKCCRIEFACFSFHVGLLFFYQLFVFQIGHRK